MKNSVLVWLGAFFAPLTPLMTIVGVFIFLDTLMGRKCARKRARELNIHPRLFVTSRKTIQGAGSKFLFYNLFVLSAYLLDKHVFYDLPNHIPFDFAITRSTVIFICIMEFDSIDEKYFKIHGITLKEIIGEKFRRVKKIFNFVTKKSDENRSN
jgi:hypothetical protein